MINFQNAMAMIQAIKNPQQMLANMGIPQEHLSSPDSAAQYLLNSGRVNQEEINKVNQIYKQIMNQ